MLKSLLVHCVLSMLLAVQLNMALTSNDTCLTPDKENGRCVNINECQYLFEILISQSLSERDREHLRESQCGYDSRQTSSVERVLVCCPVRNTLAADLRQARALAPGNVLPAPGVCGQTLSDRIYGGNVTKIDEYPWIVLVSYKKPKNEFGFHCGGVLINTRYILTAAHCVRNPGIPKDWHISSVRLGEWNLDTLEDCDIDIRGNKDCAPPHRDVNIESAVVHEQYIEGSSEQFFDIALLRTVEPIAYTDFIKPICLPVATDLRKRNFVNTAMDVAGWGMTERLQSSALKLKIRINVWNMSDCQRVYNTLQAVNLNATLQLCAGGARGIDACRGDSGGPLMVVERESNQDLYYAAGIVSYGPSPCGLEGWPGIYTRVDAFVDWILSKLAP